MRIKVTKPGIFASNGSEIAVGTELDVSAEPTGWAGRYETIGGSTEGKTPVLNPVPKTYAVKEQSPGWHAVVDADGNPVTKNFRAADLADFDAKSDAEKAAFIQGNPKPE